MTEISIGIGSDKTWNQFIEANSNRTINDYLEIVQKLGL